MYTSSYPLVVAIKSSASVKLPKDVRQSAMMSKASVNYSPYSAQQTVPQFGLVGCSTPHPEP